jgi:aryl-alcohol dehydrogenase-like predicted oxidoreductase
LEYRQLGRSGMKVPALSLGTATFGGGGAFFERWGTTQDDEAQRIVDLCLDHGIGLFDTADIYSGGLAEEILGKALKGKRDRALIASKSTLPVGTNPNEVGSSRHHLIRACEAGLKRLQTDYMDIYFRHDFDALTSVDETLRALDDLVSSGKISYIAAGGAVGGPPVDEEKLFAIVDVLEEIANERGKTTPQVAWRSRG